MFESPLNEVSSQDFSSMQNSIWNVIITFVSVGFGDIFPKTFFGRIVGISISFFGILVISFFVITVQDILNFTNNEEKAYKLITRLALKHDLKRKAVHVLSAGYYYRNIKMNHPKSTELILAAYR